MYELDYRNELSFMDSARESCQSGILGFVLCWHGNHNLVLVSSKGTLWL